MISFSNASINGSNDSTDSNDISFVGHAAKRTRIEGNAGLQKFKGLVPQQNGNWGAQIYANHQRIWLGTFKSEREAAMAYDSAAIKLRSGESHRNFPWNDETVQEPHFQSHYSTEAVLSMIKDGTYPLKFAAFLRAQPQQEGEGIEISLKQIRVNGEQNFCCTQLFQKELTPSDVGKLNRLVIPKKHAVRYFPYICGSEEENNGMEDGRAGDTQMVFYDKLMRSWKFRYCYWRSSQSYVFTRGWNRFVKDKKLQAKDVVAFYTCEPINRGKGGEMFCLIDVINNEDQRRHCIGEGKKDHLGNMIIFNEEEEEEEDHGHEVKDKKELRTSHSRLDAQNGLRLFGVRIN